MCSACAEFGAGARSCGRIKCGVCLVLVNGKGSIRGVGLRGCVQRRGPVSNWSGRCACCIFGLLCAGASPLFLVPAGVPVWRLCLFIRAVLGGWGPVCRAWSLHPEHLAPAGCTVFGSFSGPGGCHPLRVQLGVRLVSAACSSRWVVPFGQRGLLKVFAFQ